LPQTEDTPAILILTGPPAAGKSTIGPLIAQRMARCIVIDVDLLRAMVMQPHVAPWRGKAGMAQLRLGAQNACAVAQNAVEAGFHVIILDLLTDETATLYQRALHGIEHKVVLLLPSLAESLQRNQLRGQFLTDDEVRLLYRWQQRLTQYDQKLDNTAITADRIACQLYQQFFATKD